jgi:hypothetical protein
MKDFAGKSLNKIKKRIRYENGLNVDGKAVDEKECSEQEQSTILIRFEKL